MATTGGIAELRLTSCWANYAENEGAILAVHSPRNPQIASNKITSPAGVMAFRWTSPLCLVASVS